ncbi:SDR family oxidoreductase [Aestuariicella hydrocarbonica]|uniref:SDR family oxidoreductase n=1 Tax=Pseudomaricurvus hydrocarbonicus TaxID=1470433 RepID=A0A9E5MLT9_9GAMM|nr:SDR family oxidoreductase [Aestuariicella hydrocarbonica]NHO65468.1 SDR family oxidoreductase [Aestuariicella hydrocarbonica]
MDPLLDFTDKVILITGAASGFGKQLAEDFSRRGARLVLGDVNEAGVQAVAASLEGPVTAMKCNVANEAECKAMVEAATEIYGRLDIAVNNAGVGQGFMSFTDITEEVADRQFDINVKGVMYGMKHQLNVMNDQGDGVILNVSSMAGLGGAPKIAAYSAAKHAVIGLTKTAAVEYAKKGIRVNAVCPFFSLTPLVTDSELAAGGTEQLESFLSRGAPMKRLGLPQEITNVMLLLCSPGNTYMTGQTIAIDGGVSAL